jgi:hypothetical protein
MYNSFETEAMLDEAVGEYGSPYGEEEFGELEGFDYEDPESDLEDPFIGDILKSIPGPIRGALKGLARQGATYAGNAIGGQTGGRIGRGIADSVLRNINWESGDFEATQDPFGDFETVGGDMRVLQEMSHLATLAAEAPSAAQADHFLGAIAGLAGKLLPGILGGLSGEGEDEYEEERDEFFPALLPIAKMAMPLIGKGISALGGLFRRKRQTREAFMETLPVIAAKSATAIAKQAQAGKPINRKTVAATVAKETAKTLATKPAVAAAVRANQEVGGYGYRPSGYGQGGYRRQSPMGHQRRIIRPRYCVY